MQNGKTGIITLTLSAVFLLASCGGGGSSEVSEVTEMVQTALGRIDKQVEDAASLIPASELNSSQTRQVLLNLCAEESSSVDCSSVNSSGILTAVEPEQYRHAEGADISNQEQWISLHQTHQPVFSNLFKSVEGPYAIDLEWPLFNTAGTWNGSVSLMFDSTTFIINAISSASPELQQKIMIMQTDGTILFESDTSQVGLNAFTDPMFLSSPSLQEIAHHMVSEPSGEGKYQFTAEGTDEVITKQAYWKTASLHGTEWRVIVIEE